MALPSSGQISLSQVAVELSRASNAQTSLGESAVRTLAGVASGAISLSSLWGKSSYVKNGYWLGGVTGYNVVSSDVDGLNYSTEAAINPSSGLTAMRGFAAGANSLTKGYVAGGNSTSNYTNTMDGFVFSTEVGAAMSATLAAGRAYECGVNSQAKGYFLGGWSPVSAEIDGIDFSSEASINPAAAMPSACYNGNGYCSSSNGYNAGGVIGSTVTAAIVRFAFASESAAQIAATLAAGARNLADGSNSSSTGYTMGGVNGASTNYTVSDKFSFSSETSAAMSIGIIARNNVGAHNSGTTGYAAGDANYGTEIDGIVFASEAYTNTAAALTTGRGALHCGVQSYGNNP